MVTAVIGSLCTLYIYVVSRPVGSGIQLEQGSEAGENFFTGGDSKGVGRRTLLRTASYEVSNLVRPGVGHWQDIFLLGKLNGGVGGVGTIGIFHYWMMFTIELDIFLKAFQKFL